MNRISKISCNNYLVTLVLMAASTAAAIGQCNQSRFHSAAGADAAAIQEAVDQFRADLGPNNGIGKSFTSGRREINWDAVADSSSAPNPMLPFFFNTISPRGAVFASTAPPDFSNTLALQPVAVSSSPDSGVPVRFGNINPTYTTEFRTFSAPRLFTVPGSNILEITFFIPGTDVPAAVNGFGAVFADVDTPVTQILFYDTRDRILFNNCGPLETADKGLSFQGISFLEPIIAKVVIILGNAPLSAANTDGVNGVDVVAMDDFIYGEPRAIEHHAGDFDGDGTPDLSVFRASSGEWFVLNSGANTASTTQFGLEGDIPVDGDFDGDRLNDIAVFRPSSGTWFILGSLFPDNPTIINFGLTKDVPVPGDYNHDGHTDIAVWRPSVGNFFIRDRFNGSAQQIHWGREGDIPILTRSR